MAGSKQGSRARRSLAVLGVAGMAIVAAACSSSSGSSTSTTAAPRSGTSAVLAAARTTLDAGSAQMAIDIAVTVPGKGTERITGSGAFDYTTHDGSFSLNVSSLASSLGTGTLNVVVAGGTAYVQLPPSLPSVGGKWVAESSSSLSGSGNVLGGSAPGDPSELLSALQAAGAQVTNLGATQIGGTDVTEYLVNVDLSKLASVAGSGVSAQDVQSAEQALGSSTLPMHVWIDGSGRVRRLSMSFTVNPSSSGASTGGPGRADIVFDITHYGVPVQVTPPPASEVIPASELQGASGA